MSTSTLPEDMVQDFLALPEDAQYAAAQFIAFLRRQPHTAKKNGKDAKAPAKPKPPKPRIPLSEEPIIGMWKDRKDMEDSVAYVRNLRMREFRDPLWQGEPSVPEPQAEAE